MNDFSMEYDFCALLLCALPTSTRGAWHVPCCSLASRCIKHPSIGMEITDLYLVNLDKLEKIIQQFGNLPKAIFVKKVTSKSPADSAGIREDDVIVQCEENAVGLMEFTGKSWDKLERSLEVVVFRPSTGVSFKTTVLVEAVIPVTTNRLVYFKGCHTFPRKSDPLKHPLDKPSCLACALLPSLKVLVDCGAHFLSPCFPEPTLPKDQP